MLPTVHIHNYIDWVNGGLTQFSCNHPCGSNPECSQPRICSPVCVIFYRLIHLYPHLPWLHCLLVVLYKYCLCECVLVAVKFKLNFRSRSLQQVRLSLTPRLCQCRHTQVWSPVFIFAASSSPVFVPCLFLLPLLVLFLSLVYFCFLFQSCFLSLVCFCFLFWSCFCPLFISASSSGPVFVPCLFLLPLLVLFLSLVCFCFLFQSCFLSLVCFCFLFWSCFCPLFISASSSGPVFVPCLFLHPLLVLFLSLVYFCFLFWSCFCPLSISAFSSSPVFCPLFVSASFSGPVFVPCLFLLLLLVLFLSLVYFCFLFWSCFCPLFISAFSSGPVFVPPLSCDNLVAMTKIKIVKKSKLSIFTSDIQVTVFHFWEFLPSFMDAVFSPSLSFHYYFHLSSLFNILFINWVWAFFPCPSLFLCLLALLYACITNLSESADIT